MEKIRLENVDGQYVPATSKSAQGNRQKSTLDEILEKINEKYKGEFNDCKITVGLHRAYHIVIDFKL